MLELKNGEKKEDECLGCAETFVTARHPSLFL